MPNEKTSIHLLRTKLHRPPVARDHLHRQYLLDRLDARRHRPLTLVSAPAGYGKSTLVSCWLESCDCPKAWVSLDANDSDLRSFMAYFVEAIESIFPGSVINTRTMLRGTELPPVAMLAGSLINELYKIDKDFIIALDDYHTIHEKSVHDLITVLLNHPPRAMHLVLATRRDPPFALTDLRARGQMTEIRMQELRFSLSDTIAFLEKVMGMEVDRHTAAIIEEKTEGWVAGLRLAVLSIRQRTDLNRILDSLPDNNRSVMDYIISEVISKQPPDIKDYLLSTAILDRFCAPLCEALCISQDESASCSLSGQTFIDQLERNNMFVIPLDDRRRWYRFHHLFRQLLKREMTRQFKPETINDLNNRAGNWLAQNNLLDEALQHLLTAGNIPAARQLVVAHRYDLTRHEQWHRLERWINALPKAAVGNDPELLTVKAWLYENRERLPELLHVLSSVDRLLVEDPTGAPKNSAMVGELDALKSAHFYLSGNVRRAKHHADRAITQIPRHHSSELAYALLIWAFTHQMTGETIKARKEIYDALATSETAGDTYAARMLLALCWIDWLEGDLTSVRQHAGLILKIGHTHDLLESMAFGDYLLGIVSYYLAETENARSCLRAAVKNGYLVDPNTYIHGNCALALSYQAECQPEKASQISQAMIEHALQSQNTTMLHTAKAFTAELALRQGHMAEAVQWAREQAPDAPRQALRFFVPQLTLARILIAQDTTITRQKADDLLERLHVFYGSIHNKHLLIEVLSLKAMLHDSEGDRSAALADLENALILAHPSRRIHPFLDLGPKMAALLELFGHRKRFESYIGEILAAFDRFEAQTLQNIPSPQTSHLQTPSLEAAPNLDKPLTNRELEILSSLSKRLSNKEIAEELFISPETVKRHTINIYKKLASHSRQEAVTTARSLGILEE